MIICSEFNEKRKGYKIAIIQKCPPFKGPLPSKVCTSSIASFKKMTIINYKAGSIQRQGACGSSSKASLSSFSVLHHNYCHHHYHYPHGPPASESV